MDINNEIKKAEREIKKLEEEMESLQVEAQQRIDESIRKRDEIIEKSKKEGFTKCDCCKKLSKFSDFHIIEKRETEIECVYRDIINSGGNGYAIVKRENMYIKCPKCNSLNLYDTRKISEGESYSRDHNFRGFTPTSEIIKNTEDPNMRKRNELIEELSKQQEIERAAKGNISRIKSEIEKTF